MVTCNWNALGPAFLQSSDPVVEELLFLVFQPSIYRADNVLVVRKKLCLFMNSFSSGKNRSHLEPGQRFWSQVSSSTGCHPQFRLWTTPSSTIFAIRVRIVRQMAVWKIRNNNSSTTVSERWRNPEPSRFQLQVTMLKSDKIWCAYLLVNCISLWTLWTPLVSPPGLPRIL